ncbi:TM0106 family RecB-like putative nuclease [Salinifilum ghardaiensis]
MNEQVLLEAAEVSRCRRRVHLDHDPGMRGAVTAPQDPGAEQRIADAAEHRSLVAERLGHLFGSDLVVIPRGGGGAAREEATAAAMRAGAAYISDAQLPTDGQRGATGGIDLLVRFGDGYVPVLVVRHKTTNPGRGARVSAVDKPVPGAAWVDETRKPRSNARDQLRLAHAMRLLQACGMGAATSVPPLHGPAGGVIGVEADAVLWHDLGAPTWPDGRTALTEYDRRFADRVAVAAAAAAGAEPLAQPSRINECKTCPWWPVCAQQLHAARDVSLVVRGEDAAALREHGVSTVDDLAALPVSRASELPLANGKSADVVLLAKAWLNDFPMVRRNRTVQVPRADVEVDVDMESYADSGAYLWGCWLSGVDVGIRRGYHGFATWDPLPSDDEARSFAEFWTWLRRVRQLASERGLSFRAYCYNELAENRWLLSSAQRFAGKPGVPPVEDVRRFIRSHEWVDLFAVVRDQFLCPNGKGLKVVAPCAGFSWRDAEAGGANSMRWYRAAVGLGGTPAAPEQRTRLLTYNEDDVRATWTVREWMTSEGVYDVPAAADL